MLYSPQDLYTIIILAVSKLEHDKDKGGQLYLDNINSESFYHIVMTLILSFLQGHLKDKVRFQGELSAFTQGHGLQSQSSIPDFHSYRLALEESLGDFFFLSFFLLA